MFLRLRVSRRFRGFTTHCWYSHAIFKTIVKIWEISVGLFSYMGSKTLGHFKCFVLFWDVWGVCSMCVHTEASTVVAALPSGGLEGACAKEELH